MIVFDLKCDPQGHVFEGWFGSSEDYEGQRARGLVSCPVCGSANVAKAPMAPRVPRKGNQRPDGGDQRMKALLAELAVLQKKVVEQSDYVGDRFVDEARAIHLGEAEARAIYGQASPQDAESLIEEGIMVAPLPFPVVDPAKEN